MTRRGVTSVTERAILYEMHSVTEMLRYGAAHITSGERRMFEPLDDGC